MQYVVFGSYEILSNGQVGEFYVINREGKIIESNKFDFAFSRPDYNVLVMANGYRVKASEIPQTDPSVEEFLDLRNTGILGRTKISRFDQSKLKTLVNALLDTPRENASIFAFIDKVLASIGCEECVCVTAPYAHKGKNLCEPCFLAKAKKKPRQRIKT